MYRTNHCRGVSPRDHLDPRLLERLALRSEIPSDIGERCGCNKTQCIESRRENSKCGFRESTERRTEHENCDCENYNAEFNYALAMVYPQVQQWQNLYCEEDGFMSGTIFRELDKPFWGAKCRGGKMYE